MQLQNWQLWDNMCLQNRDFYSQKKQSVSYDSLQNMSTQSNQSINENTSKIGMCYPVLIDPTKNPQKMMGPVLWNQKKQGLGSNPDIKIPKPIRLKGQDLAVRTQNVQYNQSNDSVQQGSQNYISSQNILDQYLPNKIALSFSNPCIFNKYESINQYGQQNDHQLQNQNILSVKQKNQPVIDYSLVFNPLTMMIQPKKYQQGQHQTSYQQGQHQTSYQQDQQQTRYQQDLLMKYKQDIMINQKQDLLKKQQQDLLKKEQIFTLDGNYQKTKEEQNEANILYQLNNQNNQQQYSQPQPQNRVCQDLDTMLIYQFKKEQRKLKVQKYLKKKKNRKFGQIIYKARQVLAENRQRVQGRFVKITK